MLCSYFSHYKICVMDLEQVFSLTVGDDILAVPLAELSVGTDQKLAVTLRDDLGEFLWSPILLFGYRGSSPL